MEVIVFMPLFEDVVHKALSSGIRRDILLSLSKKEKYLSELANEIKKKPQTIDFHLRLLEEIGMVKGELKEGKKFYYLTDKKIIDFLKRERPVPPEFRPKPPHELVIDAWKDISKRLDRIEEKLDKVLEKK